MTSKSLATLPTYEECHDIQIHKGKFKKFLPPCHSWPCSLLTSSDTLIQISITTKSYKSRKEKKEKPNKKKKTHGQPINKQNKHNEFHLKKKKNPKKIIICAVLLRSSAPDSLTGGVANAADKSSPLLPKSLAALEEMVFFLSLRCLLWTACTLDEANLFTVTVRAINMLWPIELMAFPLRPLVF